MSKRIKLRGPLIPNDSQQVYDYYGLKRQVPESQLKIAARRW